MLILDVRLDNYTDPVGSLERNDDQSLSFQYSPQYLEQDSQQPLSLSLPLSNQVYGDVITRSFFGNLLQERTTHVQHIMDQHGIGLDNIAGILFYLGGDCTGAISVLPRGNSPTKNPGKLLKDYRQLHDEELQRIVEKLAGNQPTGVQDPSPVAGVQSKIAVTKMPDGRFALPIEGSGAPTTHILKVSSPEHPDETVLESVCLELSATSGTQTAACESMQIAGHNVICVERFDRIIKDETVYRRHQEDFAQALGLPASLKYERDGTEERRFCASNVKGLLGDMPTPIEARESFLQATIFDLLIGNVDAHAKNFSLFHNYDGSVELTPRYDLVPTRHFPDYREELAYNIGEATCFEEVDAEQILQFMTDLGFSASDRAKQRISRKYLKELSELLSGHLEYVENNGGKGLADLIAQNIRGILPKFDLDVPQNCLHRDLHVHGGGGWSMS